MICLTCSVSLMHLDVSVMQWLTSLESWKSLRVELRRQAGGRDCSLIIFATDCNFVNLTVLLICLCCFDVGRNVSPVKSNLYFLDVSWFEKLQDNARETGSGYWLNDFVYVLPHLLCFAVYTYLNMLTTTTTTATITTTTTTTSTTSFSVWLTLSLQSPPDHRVWYWILVAYYACLQISVVDP